MLEKFCPDIEVIGESALPSEAIKRIKEQKPDLAFLDIEMPEMTGLELSEALKDENCLIIFLTAHNKYAIDAFRRNAVDYLLKPAKVNDLREAVARVMKRKSVGKDVRNTLLRQVITEINNANNDTGTRDLNRIALPSAQGFIVRSLSEIIRIESDNSYSTVYTTMDKVLVSKSIGDFEKLLSSTSFVRVHNSHIINLHFLEAFQNTDGGIAIMRGGDVIPVSKRRLNQFKGLIKNHYQHF